MARASGKVILFGEHAVVYGVPAIAAGIELGAEAHATRASTSTLTIGDTTTSTAEVSDLRTAFEALLASLGLGCFQVHARTDLPPGCGLGASASLGVAIARAVLQSAAEGAAESAAESAAEGTAERAAQTQAVLAAAHAWERVFHDNPSGIDAMAATLGGCFRYTKSEVPTPISLAKPVTLAIAVAGPPAPTAEMVRSVARLKERRPQLVEKTLDGIRSLVSNAELCLKTGDWSGLGRLMDLNQMLLSGLFVSTVEIETACQQARDAGALGAKLTGAGGGGSVIALVDNNPSAVLLAWTRSGFRCFSAQIV